MDRCIRRPKGLRFAWYSYMEAVQTLLGSPYSFIGWLVALFRSAILDTMPRVPTTGRFPSPARNAMLIEHARPWGAGNHSSVQPQWKVSSLWPLETEIS